MSKIASRRNFGMPGNSSRGKRLEGFQASDFGRQTRETRRKAGFHFGIDLTRYQQPAVPGVLVPAWLTVNVPQESPDCLPVGAAETVNVLAARPPTPTL